MDAVTTAIVAALGAGVTKLGETALVDSYKALKEKIKQKFGGGDKVTTAIQELEDNSDSPARKAVLEEEVKKAGADEDQEIRAAAEELLAKVRQLTGAEAGNTLTVTGRHNIAVGGNMIGSTAVAGNRTDAKD